ncbi:MAG: CsbD family protein [Chloroflexi bacterium]|jgi:uncharacterized protein YjbJ (UPF0337 family)|nr:CsbD family protein [Chloroflexota bacterium]
MAGEIDKVTGKVKEVAGRTTGDPDLEAEGKGEGVKGHVKDAAESVKDAAKSIKDKLTGH